MNKAVVLIAGLFFILAASNAWAYSQYSQNGGDATYCGSCHGDFRATPYTSLSDGQDWGTSLHLMHRDTMLSGDCNTCHSGGSRFPVILNSSTGGNGLSPISCVGCHGRAEDNVAGNPSSLGKYGAGLRQHHDRAGIAVCRGCHADANPANYTPVGENILPPYYSNNDSNHLNMPADSCNAAGSEQYAGLINGVDNDGDGVYDLLDTDCNLLVPAPLIFDFGFVNTGSSSSPQVVTVTNGFNVTVSVSDIALSGTDAAEFSLDVGDGNGGTCGATPALLNGTSCTVSLTFSPLTTGAKSASLDISSDGGNPSVSLSGTGQTAGGSNNAPSAPQLVAPENGATVAGPDVSFGWDLSTDLDGDPVTYDLYVCEGDNTFSTPCDSPVNGAPITASAAKSGGTSFAISSAGLLFVGIALARGLGRRRTLALVLALLLISGMLMVSCGGGGGGGGGDGKNPPAGPTGDVSFNVPGLAAGATYYWKVVSTDGTDSTDSAVWSFNTQ